MALKEKKTKMPPAAGEGGKKRKKVKTGAQRSYGSYILKVLKQVHPTLRISKQAMSVMESCVGDAFERISGEASRLCRRGKGSTMTTREVQAAVRLVFPGELSRHAVSEGCKAVMAFNGEKNPEDAA
mmetsp:Transcript_17207/g.30174  ORF Transcript_17207/g.30174 Transcript_17207/m.30174 type:complete len:127 (+) Transcript_17207:62-442(+)|eukprot:CAMPEP_0197649964 /NCGR_PEP_ID=MMETSP1338-20131121/30418_1 /TAXON_ID=43686 ORGANISM="Pelagodinium beii, Strain RCC1491" /NCGR_SAMPLE_ID=MMETSP1338 /ASSEMBLY_ACC=CAM_ASM_000754 /LENGTH=126 /DNA_ID=CAMNT_0043224281 /DNA_START=62 /DNA_END=442 /DNA_ORIENTATION=-